MSSGSYAQRIADDFTTAAHLYQQRRLDDAVNRLIPDGTQDGPDAHDRIHCLVAAGALLVGQQVRQHLPTPPPGGFYGLHIEPADTMPPDLMLLGQLATAGANTDQDNLWALVIAACNPADGDRLLLNTACELMRLYAALTHPTTPKETTPSWPSLLPLLRKKWLRFWNS